MDRISWARDSPCNSLEAAASAKVPAPAALVNMELVSADRLALGEHLIACNSLVFPQRPAGRSVSLLLSLDARTVVTGQ